MGSKRIGTHDGACHKLDIVDQFVFLSCSEDGTVKLIDMRDKSTINQSRSTEAVSNTIIELNKFQHSDSSKNNKNKTEQNENLYVTNLPKMSKEKVSCYTMTLNPLDNNILAVGCRDKWVRLYDRRTLKVGDGKKAAPYILLTQHQLLHKGQPSRYSDSEGITGLAWSYDGQEIVASYSAKNIARFNLYAERSCGDFTDCLDLKKKHKENEQETKDLLSRFPNAQTSEDELSEEADQEMEEMEDGVARFLEEEENDDDDTKEPENK